MKKVKKMLFSSWVNSIVSIFLICLIGLFIYKLFNWLIIDSVVMGGAETCRKASGACIAFLVEKANFILFGFYPREEVYRPIICVLTYLVLVGLSLSPKNWRKSLFISWIIFFFVAFWLMGGGLGLAIVSSSKWGGLPLTFMLFTVGLVFSCPIGLLLALGRRSKLSMISSLCVIFIELIRGVPLISILFMSSVMFPLFLPEGMQVNKLLRAQVAIILFISAYMAEVFRGGIQAVNSGQYEAARALGLSHFKTMFFIILPQALGKVVPPTVNTAVGMFKDTSLVVIIALFDLMGTTKSSLTDYKWLGFSLEAYLFTASLYFVFCFAMGSYSRFLEQYFQKDRSV